MDTPETNEDTDRRTHAEQAPPRSIGLTKKVEKEDEALPPGDAAILIGVATATLANWRSAGRGPPYIKLGNSRSSAIRYRRSDIEAYLARMTRSPTIASEPNDE